MWTSSARDELHPISLKRNTRAEDLTRSSENKRICSSGGETTELLMSGSNQCVWDDLISREVASNLSRSVVSLSFSNGDAVLFECSGIALEHVKNATRFLTSSGFARALVDKRKDRDNLKVEVRHEGIVFPGVLREYYDLDHNIAVVVVMSSLDVDVVVLNTHGELLPDTEVLALGCGISGKSMISSGIVTGNSSVSESCRDTLKLSTCKISKVCEGGALFDYDGKFRGMNFFCDKERTFCLPTRTIFFQLEDTQSLLCTKFPVRRSFFRAIRVGEIHGGEAQNSKQAVPRGVVNEDQFEDLDSWGYPKPTASTLNDDRMILVRTFEEPFGDEFGQGVWKELAKTVSSNIQANTVALASFDGERRSFVCSGFFIEWDGCSTILTSASLVRKSGFGHKIDENLRIEVLLPNKQRRKGILQHYNLHYNIALVGVNVKDLHASCPAKFPSVNVGQVRRAVAVGYCFETCKLMAAKGELFPRPPSLTLCEYLEYSTCQISKAGIGGPLLDFDGRFLAMNFYERTVGTPYLRWNQILPVLEQFKAERSITEAGSVGDPSRVIGDRHVKLNRWHVPGAYWCHVDDEEWALFGDFQFSLD